MSYCLGKRGKSCLFPGYRTKEVFMRKHIFLFAFMVTYLLNPVCYAFNILAAKLTLSSGNETIKGLSKNVFDQTGYTLIFPDNFYSMKISGDFSNVTLNAILSSVLKGISYSLEINEAESLIFVKLFDNSSKTEITGGEGSRLSNVYYAELVRIAEENEKKYQAFRNNPDSIDPVSGLSFKEIKKRVDSAESKTQEFVNNDSSIDPFSGKTMGNARKILAKNSDRAEDLLASPDFKHPVTGENIQELRNKALKQQLELDQHPIKIQ